MLLENHGPVVAGASLDAAVFAIEELEEAAKLAIILRGMKVRHLSPDAIADLNQHLQAEVTMPRFSANLRRLVAPMDGCPKGGGSTT